MRTKRRESSPTMARSSNGSDDQKTDQKSKASDGDLRKPRISEKERGFLSSAIDLQLVKP